MRNRLLIFTLFLWAGTLLSEAQVLSRDSLYNEFRYFVRLLEETHPDPYSEYGGKVSFHKKAFETGQMLKSSDCTAEQYLNMLAVFISGLHDGHTFVNYSKRNETIRYLSVMLKTIPDGMIVKGLPIRDAKYLGSRVLSINGIPLDALCNEISKKTSNENRYGEYIKLEYMMYNPNRLTQLFPGLENKESLRMQVQTPDDEIKELEIPVTENREWYKDDFVQLPKQSALSKDEYLYYDVVDGKQTMYLRLNSVMARENFLYMQQQKWPSFEDQLKRFYQWTLKKEMPEHVDEAVTRLPCFAEMFRNMLSEMKRDGIRNLIIDLRGNSGGWTPIARPSLYMLYGDKYLDADMGINYYRMFSPLYIKKTGITLEDFNKKNHSDYCYGDYSFSQPSDENLTQEKKREQFVENAIGNGGDYIKDLNGKAVYTPETVYVLTDADTFSAAFHYAFYLWKMGAVIAGVPSAQAPNTFMEVTEFELPYTKITGSISNSVQYFLPPTDRRAKTFWPDIMPEYKDYKKYNFDQDAELLWLLDRIP